MKHKLLILFSAFLIGNLSVYAYDFEKNGICYNTTSSNTVEVTYGYIGWDNSNGVYAYIEDHQIREYYDSNQEDWYYYNIGLQMNYDNTYATVTGYAYSGDLVIPTSVTNDGNTYKVTSIGQHAFENCSTLSSICIPSTVESIGERAFYNCTTLTNWTVKCTTPPVLNISASDISSGATLHIPAGTREAYEATNFSVFSNIEEIISFSYSSVKSICVDNWDTNVDGELSVSEAAAVTSFGSVFQNNTNIYSFNELQYFTGLTSIGGSAFSGCTSLRSVTLPSSVTAIGSYAFENCYGLRSVTLPSSVTVIGSYAFENCYGLTSVTIPSSVTRIEDHAYYNCRNIKDVTIPSSVTSIGWSAFGGFSSDNYTPNIHISDLAAWCSITFDSLSGFFYYLYINDERVDDLVIPNTITKIGNYVFRYCQLTSVEIPSTVTSIGAGAFYGSSLTSASLPNTIERINKETFSQCTHLTSVNIPNSVLSIGEDAFMDCENLPSVCIPNSVTTIGEYAFYGCSQLMNISIGNSVTSIGKFAFVTGCTLDGLVMAVGTETPVSVDDSCLPNNSRYGALYVPVGCKAAYEADNNWKKFGNIVELSATSPVIEFADPAAKAVCVKYYDINGDGELSEDEAAGVAYFPTKIFGYNDDIISFNELRYFTGLKEIGNAFYCCKNLSSITLPNGVKTIGCNGFDYTNLTSIDIPSSVTRLYNCFSNSMESITVHWSTPISLEIQITNNANATLYVPYGSKAAYEAADYWKKFKTIIEMAPETEPADIADGTYLLKNVSTGLYLNKGNRWGTHAVLSEEALPVRISQQEDGSYTLYFPYGSFNQQLLFRDDHENVYVDYNGQEDGCPYWTITQQGDRYYIQSLTTHPVYGQEAMPGTYLGNNPEKEASDQDDNALGVYNDVDGNVTVGMNITWQIEADGPHTAAQEETLSQLNATLQELGLDNSWAQSVLDNSASTYSEMFGAICDASQRIEQQQQEIALYNAQQRQELQRELQRLISSAQQLGMSTTEAEAVVDNDNASMEEIRTAISTLRTDFITRLGEGIDNSLLPLDVTGVISNPTFSIDDAYGWNYDDDNAPQFQTYHNAEYFQTAFDLHQTLTGLPNGSYVLRMKGFHRPGNNQTVFTQFKEGTNNASAELYANNEHIVLQHQATGARDNGDLGGAEVSYGDQTWYVPNSMQEARSWFDAEEGYFENELPVTVTDGTLTIGVRLGESVDEGWVIFDDFRLEYIPDNQLYVDETPSVLRGSKAELNISLRNAGAVSSTDFYLLLPAGMTIVNSAVSIAADRSDNHQVSALLNEEGGYYHIVCHSGNNNVFKENDGLLFSMTIACDESVAAGSYEGQMKNILMWDSSKVESSQPDFTFSIEVPEQQLGDVNADSRINVGDIMEVVDNIMRRPSDNFNFAAANLYYDKKINVFDLVRLINLVLRQPMTSNTLSLARRLSRMMSDEATAVVSGLTIADFGINPGEQQTVDIELSNADHPYSLLQFVLRLPEGVSLAKGQDDKWAIAPNSIRITSAHVVEVVDLGQGIYQFLVYSSGNAAIEGSSGAIMTLTLTASADAPVGMQQGSIAEQVFAEADEDGYEPADVSFSVNVGLLRGDANGDGRVSIADVVAVVDYITTNGNPTGQFVASAADTDGVEGITIADAVAIVNMIIGE